MDERHSGSASYYGRRSLGQISLFRWNRRKMNHTNGVPDNTVWSPAVPAHERFVAFAELQTGQKGLNSGNAKRKGNMKSLLKVLTLAAAFQITSWPLISAESTKTYQVTGPILEVTDKVVVVQKGEERWEVARD